jgi:nucleoside-diphosphate-sugar epimerase
MDWTGKKVLVTGAGGFIGSHLVDRLTALGAEVTGFIRYNSRNQHGFLGPDCRVALGDLASYESVEAAAKNHQVVFHLGAIISVPYSFAHSVETVQANTIGTLNVLQAAQAANSERVIVTSTSEVYGTAQYVPIDELHPKNSQSPYAASKIAADSLALSYHAVHSLPVTVIRPFNTYGPRQSDRAIIPTLISQIAVRDHLELGNLDATRDFTYVSDTVGGMIAAADANSFGQEFNLGTGTEISIGCLAEKLMNLMGRQLPIVESAERVRSQGAEVRRLLSNNQKARTILGWAPAVSLDEGLSKTIEYVIAHPEQYDPAKYRV